MMLSNLRKASELVTKLDKVNDRIVNMWRYNNHPDTTKDFGSTASWAAEQAAKKAIEAVLINERNEILLSMKQIGIEFEE